MPYYDFKKKDILHNVIKAYPEYSFDINQARIFINNESSVTGTYVTNAGHVPTGHINLYELNVDRNAALHTYDPDVETPGTDVGSGVKSLVFPFVVKDSSLGSIGTITTAKFNTSFSYGDEITSSYPLSSSIVREFTSSGHGAPAGSRIRALKNTLNNYKTLSNHYAFSSALGDKAQQNVNLISIPSIFYDSSIKKGTVNLKFYISGTLIGELNDKYQNGELIQIGPVGSTGSGSVAGVALYSEGFVFLTGSWDLSPSTYDFGFASNKTPQWIYFGAGANDGLDSTEVSPSASFNMSFNGVSKIPTITMLAHAPIGAVNNSTNPTFINNLSASISYTTSSFGYVEPTELPIKNTISSSFYNYEEKFKKQVFISKIGIYDEDKNLIAIAKLAKPVKKPEDRDITFKLKLDI